MIQTIYDALIRSYLPNKIIVKNGVATNTGKLFDFTDEKPNYEEELVDSIVDSVEVEDDIVLVGGGQGVSSVTSYYWSHSEVITYEASGELCETIRETAELNNAEIDVRHGEVADGKDYWGKVDSPPQISPEELEEPNVLILDCEGAEQTILKEMTIEPRKILVETHGLFDAPTDETEEILNDIGYEVIDRKLCEEENDVYVLTAERR